MLYCADFRSVKQMYLRADLNCGAGFTKTVDVDWQQYKNHVTVCQISDMVSHRFVQF